MVCFVYFFLQDQLNAFIIGRSTVTHSYKDGETLHFPTLIFCMDPATKISVSKKYGFKTYRDKYNNEVENTTYDQRYEELSYILNRRVTKLRKP